MYIHFLKNQESFANKLSKKIQNPCPVDRLLLVWLDLGCLIYHILS